MKSRYLFFLVACIAAGSLVSCGSGKELTSESSGVKKVACGKVDMEADVPHIDWFEANRAALEKDKELNLPVAYHVYTVEETQLNRFFETAVEQSSDKEVKTVVPLGGAGCQVFTVKRSGTMSPELSKKYPELVSLSGTGTNGTGDLRLDFDGKKMNGQVIWRNETYLISPVEHSNKTYYIIYKKSDSAVEKQPFESETK